MRKEYRVIGKSCRSIFEWQSCFVGRKLGVCSAAFEKKTLSGVTMRQKILFLESSDIS